MSLILIPGSFVLAKDKVNTDKYDVERLMNLGFTMDEINDFTETDYELFKDKNGKVIDKDTKYYRVDKDGNKKEVTENEAMIAIKEIKDKENPNKKQSELVTTLDTFTGENDGEGWLKMVLTVTELVDGSYAFKNSYTWLIDPVYTLTDVIAMSHQEYLSPKYSSEILKYQWDNYAIDDNNNIYFVDTDWEYDFNAHYKETVGWGDDLDLRGYDGTYDPRNNRGYFYYEAELASSQYTIGDLYGHYAHTKYFANYSVSISFAGLTVTGDWKTVIDEPDDAHCDITF